MHLFGTPSLLRRIAPRGLLARSVMILVVPLILMQLISGYIFYDRHWDTIMRRLAASIAGDIAVVLELRQRYPGPENQAWIFDLGLRTMDLDFRLHPGEILPNITRPSSIGTLEGAMAAALEERVRRPAHVETGFIQRELVIRLQLSEGVMEILASRKRLFSSTTYLFVMWMVGASMVLFGIATIFMSNQVRSIRRLAASADGFGKGRDLPPIKPEGAREVRQAATAFNLMRERIQRQISQRTEMLAGVSHDLRTPLTRMKLQLALMGDSPEAADLAEDVAEMERMIEGYLAFARGEGEEPASTVDLPTLLEDCLNRFRRSATTLDITLTTPLPALPPLLLRRGAIDRCLNNLIGNATRYGRGVIRVSMALATGPLGDSVEIVLEDNGPGIPADCREDVFRPFHRLDPSRNPKTGGTGLGLTIARDIARSHGGDILLGDSPDLGGLKVTLRLPL